MKLRIKEVERVGGSRFHLEHKWLGLIWRPLTISMLGCHLPRVYDTYAQAVYQAEKEHRARVVALEKARAEKRDQKKVSTKIVWSLDSRHG